MFTPQNRNGDRLLGNFLINQQQLNYLIYQHQIEELNQQINLLNQEIQRSVIENLDNFNSKSDKRKHLQSARFGLLIAMLASALPLIVTLIIGLNPLIFLITVAVNAALFLAKTALDIAITSLNNKLSIYDVVQNRNLSQIYKNHTVYNLSQTRNIFILIACIATPIALALIQFYPFTLFYVAGALLSIFASAIALDVAISIHSRKDLPPYDVMVNALLAQAPQPNIADQLRVVQASTPHREFHDDPENTHRAEVHASTANAVLALRKRYPINDVDIITTFKKLRELLQRNTPESKIILSDDALANAGMTKVDLTAATRALNYLESTSWEEALSKTNFPSVLTLVWKCIQDTNLKNRGTEEYTDKEGISRKHNFQYNLIRLLVLNLSETHIRSANALPLCPGGIFNKLVETLDQLDPDVNIIRTVNEVAINRMYQHLNEHFDNLEDLEKYQLYSNVFPKKNQASNPKRDQVSIPQNLLKTLAAEVKAILTQEYIANYDNPPLSKEIRDAILENMSSLSPFGEKLQWDRKTAQLLLDRVLDHSDKSLEAVTSSYPAGTFHPEMIASVQSYLAAMKGNFPAAEAALKDIEISKPFFLLNLSPSKGNYKNRTLLNLAAANGQISLVRLLLHSFDVDVTVKEPQGGTAIHRALTNNHHICAREIFEKLPAKDQAKFSSISIIRDHMQKTNQFANMRKRNENTKIIPLTTSSSTQPRPQ